MSFPNDEPSPTELAIASSRISVVSSHFSRPTFDGALKWSIICIKLVTLKENEKKNVNKIK